MCWHYYWKRCLSSCSFHRCSFTPFTRSQKMSDAAPRMAKIAIKGKRRPPSGGYRKVSQPKPPSTDNIPRMRGRKVDFDNEVAREDCIESKKYQRDASAFVIDLEKEAPAPATVPR